MARIHILGASGSGTSTLGEALGHALAIRHQDSDEIYWLPTEPPFTTARAVIERQALLRDRLKPDENWILSGSAISWATPVEAHYELIVYLRLDPRLRMERLQKREQFRHGARIAANGDMAEASAAFLSWAAAYDTAGLEQRSRTTHDAWLATRSTPVIRLDSAEPVPNLIASVRSALR